MATDEMTQRLKEQFVRERQTSMTVRCTVCGAKPGARCTDQTGRVLAAEPSHLSRLTRAQAIAEIDRANARYIAEEYEKERSIAWSE